LIGDFSAPVAFSDELYGEDGDEGDNDDAITDFEFGFDSLQFEPNTAINDLEDLDGWRVDQEGDDVVIDISDNFLTLEGVDANEFIDFVHSSAAADFFTFG
jgi:hypothetical protein